MTSIFLNCSKLCNTPFSVRNFLRLKMTFYSLDIK